MGALILVFNLMMAEIYIFMAATPAFFGALIGAVATVLGIVNRRKFRTMSGTKRGWLIAVIAVMGALAVVLLAVGFVNMSKAIGELF